MKRMRAILAGLVVVAVGVGSAPPAGAYFPDVPPSVYYEDAVDWLEAAGITTGVGTTGLFKPDDIVNRAQMATFLWRLRDKPSAKRHSFPDVPSGSYYDSAVSWLAAAGITNGVGNTGLFKPNDVVTRAQMAAFLHRLAGSPGGAPQNNFVDVPKSSYYNSAVSWMLQHRITTGVGGSNRFEPNAPVTRGQMAAFLFRLTTSPKAWNKSKTWVLGPGEYRVGSEVPAGTYRTRANRDGCYWERLSGFSGSIGDIIGNDFSFVSQVVTIAPGDKGFYSDFECGMWTNDLSRITKSKTAPFLPGTYIVGVDIAPGTWRSSGGKDCYWERVSAFSGRVEHIIANGFQDTKATVTIAPSDKGFRAELGCGTWTKIG